MRLIDADALRKELRKNLCPISGVDKYYFRQLIDAAPTIAINTRKIEYEAYSKGLEDGKKIARSTDMTITEDLKE